MASLGRLHTRPLVPLALSDLLRLVVVDSLAALHRTGSRWLAPTGARRDGLDRLPAHTSTRPRDSRWPAPTGAPRDDLPQLHSYTSTGSRDSRWRAPHSSTSSWPLQAACAHVSSCPRGSRWPVPTGAPRAGLPVLHRNTSPRPMGSRWRAPTGAPRDGRPRLHSCTSSCPRDSRWRAPTGARQDGLPGPHSHTSTCPMDSR
jgi:hypothetical protein